jgi:UDP-N-acetyl-D-glucosamine dehydrogenase
VGGHCIPLDPQYLAWRAREANFATRFIETADQVNTAMPEYTTQRIADLLNSAGKAVRDSRILVVGIAYKPNVSDDRESASVDVAERLVGRGARVSVFDPHLDSGRIEALGFEVTTLDDNLGDFDLAAILTDHADLPYSTIADEVPLVFDSRGVYRRLGIQALNVEAL